MGEYPQFGKLLVEIPGDSSSDIAHFQNLCHNIVVLPAAPISGAAMRVRHQLFQIQVLKIDALVPGKSGVSRPRLHACNKQFKFLSFSPAILH